MVTAGDLVSDLGDLWTEPLAGTDFRDLDELMGGLRPGHVLVITGRPGQGKTTLALQWALAVARQDHPVQLVCPREPGRWIAARMVSMSGRVPLYQMTRGGMDDELRIRFGEAQKRVARLPITVFPQPGPGFSPRTDSFDAATRPRAVVVDDADLVSDVTPDLASMWAGMGLLVILTLPREKVLLTDDDEAPLDPPWTRNCDVVLEVRHRGLLPRGTRQGEADLLVHRHRWGPTRDIAVSFQGHYSRFLDLRA